MNNFVTVEHLPWEHDQDGNNKKIANYILSKHNANTTKKIIIFFIETPAFMCKRKHSVFQNNFGDWHPLAIVQRSKRFKYHSLMFVTVPCMRNFPFNYILLNSTKKELIQRKGDLKKIVILSGYKKIAQEYDDDDDFSFTNILFNISKLLKKDITNMNVWDIFQSISKIKSKYSYSDIEYAIQSITSLLENVNYLSTYPEFKNVFQIRGRVDFYSLSKITMQYREIQTMQNIEYTMISNINKFKSLFPSCRSIYEVFQKHVSLYLLFGAAHTFNDDYFSNLKIRAKIKKIKSLHRRCEEIEEQKSRRLSLRKSWIRYNNQKINWSKVYKTYCNPKIWNRTIQRKTKGVRDYQSLTKSKLDKLDCKKYNCAVLFEIPFDRKKFSDIFYPGINSLKSNCFYRFTELGAHILPISVFKRNSKTVFVFDFQETSFLIYNKIKIEKSEADRMDKIFNAAQKIILKCYGIFKNNPNLSEYHLKELDLLAVQIDCYLK